MTRSARFKRIIAALLALAAVVCLLPAPKARADAGVTRVRVLLSTEDAGSLSIPVAGAYTLKEAARGFQNGTLSVKASGSTVTVSHSTEGTLYSGSEANIERVDPDRGAGALTLRVASGTRQFLGNFTFRASNGVLSVVNTVPLSHYLYGVVAYEMSDTFPLEALKAQAIAAKGYVLLHIRSTGRYDIGDTAADQVYRGYNASNTNVIAAVDATMADVLYYNGSVLQCYYAASNGGWMILPSVRWGDDIYDGAFNKGADPYDLRNPSTPVETVCIPANYSDKLMGTAAFSFLDARLMNAIALGGVIPQDFAFAGIQSIDRVVSSVDAGDRDDKNHTVVDVDATVRAARNANTIPTPTPSFPPTPSPTPMPPATPSPTPTHEPTPSPTPAFEPSPTPEGQTPSPTPVGQTPSPSPAPTPEGQTPSPSPEPTPTPSPTPMHPATPSPTPTHEPTPSPTPSHAPTPSPTPEIELVREVKTAVRFTFAEMIAAGLYTQSSLRIYYAEPVIGGWALRHARYGHGVGMSQRGAQQMANEGKSCREILSFYYPGATLGTIGYVFPESLAAAQQTTADTIASTGAVQNGTVNLRKRATTSSDSLEKLDEGTNLTLLGMTGAWYYTLAPSGNTGYVRFDYVRLTGSNMIAKGVVDGSAVNLRSGPATSYDGIEKLSLQTPLGVYGMVDGWYKVKAMTTGSVGFIHQDYVKLTEEVAQNAAMPTSQPAASAPAATQTPQTPATPTPIVIAPLTPTPSPSPAPTPTPITIPITSEFAAGGYVNGSGVNIRAGSSTSTESYGKLARNTALGLYQKLGSWYRVRVLATGQDGYIYAKYVTMTNGSNTSAETGTSSSAGYINASGVNIRTGASTRYQSLGRLKRNTTLKILGSSGSWYRVSIASLDAEGYVFAKYVTMTGTTKQDTYSGAITGRLNLRNMPGTGASSKILLTMPRGAVVTVHSVSNGWCFVTYDGTTGYCASSYVRIG